MLDWVFFQTQTLFSVIIRLPLTLPKPFGDFPFFAIVANWNERSCSIAAARKLSVCPEFKESFPLGCVHQTKFPRRRNNYCLGKDELSQQRFLGKERMTYLFSLLTHSRFWHLKYQHSVLDLACLTSSSPAVQWRTQLFSPNGLPNDSWTLNVARVV